MDNVYVVFKEEIFVMCYDIIVFDSVHLTVTSAEKRIKEINQYDSNAKAYYETNDLLNNK